MRGGDLELVESLPVVSEGFTELSRGAVVDEGAFAISQRTKDFSEARVVADALALHAQVRGVRFDERLVGGERLLAQALRLGETLQAHQHLHDADLSLQE